MFKMCLKYVNTACILLKQNPFNSEVNKFESTSRMSHKTRQKLSPVKPAVKKREIRINQQSFRSIRRPGHPRCAAHVIFPFFTDFRSCGSFKKCFRLGFVLTSFLRGFYLFYMMVFALRVAAQGVGYFRYQGRKLPNYIRNIFCPMILNQKRVGSPSRIFLEAISILIAFVP